MEMLADRHLQGCYLIPGVPNTTSVTQETDQNYSDFKDGYRANIRKLSQARFKNNMGTRVTDLPLLVFGGTCNKTNVVLKNTFQDSFDHASNLSVWNACGAVPLTRSVLQSDKVRHEVPVMEALEQQEGLTISQDSKEIKKLVELDRINQFNCNVLSANGFDGTQLRIEASKRKHTSLS